MFKVVQWYVEHVTHNPHWITASRDDDVIDENVKTVIWLKKFTYEYTNKVLIKYKLILAVVRVERAPLKCLQKVMQ